MKKTANKLELTWFGKDETKNIEPRLFIENTELSNISFEHKKDRK